MIRKIFAQKKLKKTFCRTFFFFWSKLFRRLLLSEASRRRSQKLLSSPYYVSEAARQAGRVRFARQKQVWLSLGSLVPTVICSHALKWMLHFREEEEENFDGASAFWRKRRRKNSKFGFFCWFDFDFLATS
jgi:hypothetical protein